VNENADGERTQGDRRTQGYWRPIVLLLLILAAVVAAWLFDAGRRAAELKDWIGGLGPAAPIVFVLLRAGLAVAVIPGSLLTASAGLVFHPAVAIVCVSVGKTLGAAIAFLIARYFARDAVARWLTTKPRWRRLDGLVAERGALVVALARLIPVIPFNVQNYGFGLTPVPFGKYLFWSWLCMLPSAFFVVTGAGVVSRTLATGRVPWALVAVFGASALVMAGFGLYAAVKLYFRWSSSGKP
jgi:uncharacterized membrane protein YdjX (TVP38/TMEM64 family)